MGSKPKKQDYKASEGEKASAAVAMAEYTYFKQKYEPLLLKMRDESGSKRAEKTLKGRENANTMQALTTEPMAQMAIDGRGADDLSKAYQMQLGQADMKAGQIRNQAQMNVLSTARQQGFDAQRGMTQAASLQTSAALSRARDKQKVSQAKMTALGQIAGATLVKGMQNRATTGTREGAMPEGQSGPGAPETVRGSFFSPVDDAGDKVSGFGNRLSHSNFFRS